MSKEVPKVIYTEIPSLHSYAEVWDLQKHLQQRLVQSKRKGKSGEPGYLLFCEHRPVITIGKSGKMDHLTASKLELENASIEFHKINRGGDITFHGPGQLTVYPILDLDQYYNDVHRYVREIEEVVIRTLDYFGIKGSRVDGYTGVWIIDGQGRRKIAAIGVHMSRWVSMHGMALNVNTDLSHFDRIIPCGIVDEDTSVTSISQELRQPINLETVREQLRKHFSDVFGFTYLDNQTFVYAAS